MTVRTSPCDWPVVYSECVGEDGEPGRCEPLVSSPVSGDFETMATDYLWNWTGRKLGVCSVSLRPCRENCNQYRSTFWGNRPGVIGDRSTYVPVLIQGQWWNIACGFCGNSCGCGNTSVLRLPGPVVEITEILIDGAVLPSTSYKVDNGNLLTRTDGGRWPTCQNMGADITEDDTWQITYTLGIPVPIGGQIAAGVFACELAKAACGDSDCQLPSRVQSITRQGVTVAVLDAFDGIDQGHTGIWIIDSWVASMTKPRSASRVLSPDVPRDGRFRRRTS